MMIEQERNEGGKFVTKGDAVRAVRSIRLTDDIWAALGDKADEQDMTRADYLEALFAGDIEWESDSDRSDQPDLDFDPNEVAELLREALTLKANAGGKIKSKIREVLGLMGFDSDENDWYSAYYSVLVI